MILEEALLQARKVCNRYPQRMTRVVAALHVGQRRRLEVEEGCHRDDAGAHAAIGAVEDLCANEGDIEAVAYVAEARLLAKLALGAVVEALVLLEEAAGQGVEAGPG